jgi:hypothetical protein
MGVGVRSHGSSGRMVYLSKASSIVFSTHGTKAWVCQDRDLVIQRTLENWIEWLNILLAVYVIRITVALMIPC